jgi:hypothetical protein
MNPLMTRVVEPPFLFALTPAWYDKIINVFEKVYGLTDARRIFPPDKVFVCIGIKNLEDEGMEIRLLTTTERIHGVPLQLEDRMVEILPLGEYLGYYYAGSYKN